MSNYMIGTTEESMAYIDDLGIVADPLPSYRPFSVAVRAGDGTLQGHGFPVATWHWTVMRRGEIDILRNFLSGNLSANVYIRTRLNQMSNDAYTWGVFACVMNWPAGDEDIQAGRILDVTIEFSHMVLIEEDET